MIKWKRMFGLVSFRGGNNNSHLSWTKISAWKKIPPFPAEYMWDKIKVVLLDKSYMTLSFYIIYNRDKAALAENKSTHIMHKIYLLTINEMLLQWIFVLSL